MVPMMQSLNELTPGRLLGRYELLMPVAQGGMAAVWAARLRGTRGFQKVVAIKTILPTLSDDPRFEQMFLDEAALASRIRHGNVAQVLDLGEDQGLLYQVMEWIEGQALNQLVRESPGGRGLPHPIATKVMIGVCEGMHAAHEMRDDAGNLIGLVHRDISPQNILVSSDGVAKVVDFGVAKASTLSSARTAAGVFKGKPAYMAPEQILGGEVDRRADVFALGVVLYIITTGRHPFRADTDLATLHRICDPKPPRKPSEIYVDYPKSLEDVVMGAIEKDLAKRYQSAAEMARALQDCLPTKQHVGDTEVAKCVMTLGGDQLKSRAIALKKALAEAEARDAANPSSSPNSVRSGSMPSVPRLDAPVSLIKSSPPSTTVDPKPVSTLRGPGFVSPPKPPPVPRHPRTLQSAGVEVTAPGRPLNVAVTTPRPPDVTADLPVVSTVPQPAKRSLALPVGVGLVLAAAGLLLVLAFTLRKPPRKESSSGPLPSVATVAPTASSDRSPETPADDAGTSLNPDSLPKVQPGDPPSHIRPGGGPRVKGTAAGSASTAPTAPANTQGNVPSIRDPGF